jgi:hypothetical protein
MKKQMALILLMNTLSISKLHGQWSELMELKPEMGSK